MIICTCYHYLSCCLFQTSSNILTLISQYYSLILAMLLRLLVLSVRHKVLGRWHWIRWAYSMRYFQQGLSPLVCSPTVPYSCFLLCWQRDGGLSVVREITSQSLISSWVWHKPPWGLCQTQQVGLFKFSTPLSSSVVKGLYMFYCIYQCCL